MTSADTAAPLTAEQIAAIRTLDAQRDSECPWLFRTAEIRWQLEGMARNAIIPALDMIEASDREIAALRDRLARVEGALRLCDDDSVATYLRQEARIKALEGERDRLRDWLNIAKKFVWDEEIVENIDAELAAAPTPASEDAGGAR